MGAPGVTVVDAGWPTGPPCCTVGCGAIVAGVVDVVTGVVDVVTGVVDVVRGVVVAAMLVTAVALEQG